MVSQSFKLLRDDPKLIVFPVLSALGVVALSLPFLLIALLGQGLQGNDFHWGPRTWLFTFGWYTAVSFVTIFFNCALAANGYPVFWAPAILWFATMFAAFTAASKIFTVVLYRYATTGDTPAGFDIPR
jgi:hypothetical protein